MDLTPFAICSTDEDCLDFDGCTIDVCNIDSKLCSNQYQSEDDCIDCKWFSFNLTTDNYPDETTWFLTDAETNTLIASGDPHPYFLKEDSLLNAAGM